MKPRSLIQKVKKLLPRCGSLLLLFQRSPLVQMLFPEVKLLTSMAAVDTPTMVIATVVGLGAYDSVAGATTVSQVSPAPGSSTVPVTSGTNLTGVFQIVGGGGHTPQSWSISSGTLPTGLTLANMKGKTTTLTGATSQTGNHTVAIRAWENSNFSGRSATGSFTLQVAAPPGTAIATQPASMTINSGQTATLTVTATGGAPLTYQWYEGTAGDTSRPVGTNSASLTTPALTATTSYWVKVTNTQNPNGAGSDTATVTVRQPAAIATQPVGTAIESGGQTTLSVIAGGDAPLTYQWYEGLSGITTVPVGGNASTFTTPPLLSTTSYWVKVTNVANPTGAISTAATVTVQPSATPSIIVLSSPELGHVGKAYNLHLTAAGGTTPYQWTVSIGTLPQGLTLSTGGEISGIPQIPGTHDFTIQLEDNQGLTDTQVYRIIVGDLAVTSLTLPTAVKGTPFTHNLTAIGGQSDYTWQISAGALPAGITLSSTGILAGTPLNAGNAAFTVRVTDSTGFHATQDLTLPVSATFLVPVVEPFELSKVTIGTDFKFTVSASNYPKTFVITGLPPGLKYVAATGVISGRTTTAGDYPVNVKASNSAGTSTVESSTLHVMSLSANVVGSFIGVCGRDPNANGGLGSLLSLTTTAKGSYSLKVTTGTTAMTAVGYLKDSIPQITTTVGTSAISLTLNDETNLLSGTYGESQVTGWRSTWNPKSQPMTQRAGYYSASLDLASSADRGIISIPQGSGYITLKTTPAGIVTVAGKMADGQAITSSGFVGPDGQAAIYTSLYVRLGSLCGILSLSEDASGITNNAISGTLSWFKPGNTSRTYGPGFGPLELQADGHYLSAAAGKGIVSGLPVPGFSSLAFTDGGLQLAALDPDVSAFTYSDKYIVTMPPAGGPDNPAKTTLSINKATGVVNGTFTLLDGTMTRKVKFEGMIVRPASGDSKATGYFLLPQIPAPGTKATAAPILSGGIKIIQSTQTPP